MRKKFKAGLESLFMEREEEQVVHYAPETPKSEVITAVKEAPKSKKSGKDFSSDLGHAMQDAFIKQEEDFIAQDENLRISDLSKRPFRKPLSGLESLLRKTIDSEELDNETKRRIVVIIESGKVERLKSIAKGESLFLKDIIERCVNLFLEDYDTKHAIV
jgi:hypothetical protein